MAPTTVESSGCAGGAGGKTPTPSPFDVTTIDLRKPGDVAMVLRAVQNGWDVPTEIRAAICGQVDAALDAAEGSPRRVVKLARLFALMSARNMIAEGHGPSAFPYLRRRHPEQRRPRRERPPAAVRRILNMPGR